MVRANFVLITRKIIESRHHARWLLSLSLLGEYIRILHKELTTTTINYQLSTIIYQVHLSIVEDLFLLSAIISILNI